MTYIFMTVSWQYKVDKKSRQWRKYWLWNKKKKAVKQEIGYEFIRIDSDQEGFDVFRVIN